MTPLSLACKFNHVSLVCSLLKNNANALVKDEDGETPLHVACRKGNPEVVDILCNHLLKIDKKESLDWKESLSEWTPLIICGTYFSLLYPH